MRIILVSVALLLFVSTAQAGVTIHYEGYASSPKAMAEILAAATAFAKKRGWKVESQSASQGVLQRVINEKNADYQGRITGIVIHPHENCEPLYIQFGDDLFMQDYVKTQFAGAEIHVLIAELFTELKPHFKQLTIDDEGEYWESRDRAILEKHISTVNRMIQDIKKEKPKSKGPVTLPSGRIIDVIQ